MEACVTLGMLSAAQARRLAEAGLTAYNHNLDTSPEFYGEIITTRTYQDRLDTLSHVREAGIQVCCGGIIGMGESVEDRARLLETLANLDPHPESVPINALVAVPGTPLEDQPPIDSSISFAWWRPRAFSCRRRMCGFRLGAVRCRARRRFSASSPERTQSSTATSSSPPPITTRPTISL
jgi:hypothetical protein